MSLSVLQTTYEHLQLHPPARIPTRGFTRKTSISYREVPFTRISPKLGGRAGVAGNPGSSDPATAAKSEVAQVFNTVAVVFARPSLKVTVLLPLAVLSQPVPQTEFEIVKPPMMSFRPAPPLYLMVR